MIQRMSGAINFDELKSNHDPTDSWIITINGLRSQ
jgi:hypothetical protein